MALTAKANDMRQKGDNVIILTVGEPDFDTPNHIKEAAVSAINQGQTKYTAIDGTPNLKKAIIHKFQNENGLSYSPDQIIASNGCKQSLFNFLQASRIATISPCAVGSFDEVTLFEPSAIILLSLTITLPKGPPFLLTLSIESSIALFINSFFII